LERIRQKHKKELDLFESQRKNMRRLWNIEQRSAELLYTIIEVTKPVRILEIGTSNGFSTFWLSLAAETCGAIVDTIEVDKNRYQIAKENLKNRDNIIQHFGKAELIIPSLTYNYDFIFIDAGKINYIDYIKLLSDKLKDSAIIIADNVISHKHTVIEYLDYIKSSMLFDSVTLNIDAGINVAIYNAYKNNTRSSN